MPGLAIDRYGDVVVIHADAADLLERWLPEIRTDLGDFRSAYAKIHPRAASHLAADQVRRLAPEEPVWGTPRPEIEVLEHGVRYLVRADAGLSVGLFLDMREVRSWLRGNAADRRVLNLFAYTCSFGVNAALGRAARVLNLDLSRGYLDWGKTNYNYPKQPAAEDWGKTVTNIRPIDTDAHDFNKTFIPGGQRSSAPEWGMTEALAHDRQFVQAGLAQEMAELGNSRVVLNLVSTLIFFP